MSVIDLSALPAPKIIEELSFEEIYQQRKQRLLELYPQAADTLELESEPLAYLLQESAYRETILRQRINEAVKATMLALAGGSDLDQVVANNNTQRLIIQEGDADNPTIYEDDESLRLRGQQSFNMLTTAGPRSQYEILAKSADGRIADASAISEAPAEVSITVLTHEGNPDTELLNKVRAALSQEDKTPIGDRLHINPATITNYQIEAVLHINSTPESSLVLAAAQEKLKNWLQKQELGNSLYLSKLISTLDVPGVLHVEIIRPVANIILNRKQFARCTHSLITTAVNND